MMSIYPNAYLIKTLKNKLINKTYIHKPFLYPYSEWMLHITLYSTDHTVPIISLRFVYWLSCLILSCTPLFLFFLFRCHPSLCCIQGRRRRRRLMHKIIVWYISCFSSFPIMYVWEEKELVKWLICTHPLREDGAVFSLNLSLLSTSFPRVETIF